jgi:hypothetical protein
VALVAAAPAAFRASPAVLASANTWIKANYDIQMDASNPTTYAAQVDSARKGKDFKSLSRDEVFAIKVYVEDGFTKMNPALRADPKTTPFAADPGLKAAIDAATSGLERLPAHQGKVFRGANLKPEIIERYAQAAKDGKPVTEAAFTSTTVSRSVGEEFGSALFVIDCAAGGKSRGKDVSALANPMNAGIGGVKAEAEILFPPGTRFEVVSVKKSGEGAVITMREASQ